MNGTVTLNKEFCQIPSAVVPICLLSCKRRAVHSFGYPSQLICHFEVCRQTCSELQLRA